MESSEEITRMKNTLDAHTKKLDTLMKKKPNRVKLTRMKFVGVPFDPEKYKAGEAEINDALANGFEVMRDFETGGGIAVCLSKWEKPQRKDVDGPKDVEADCHCEECKE